MVSIRSLVMLTLSALLFISSCSTPTNTSPEGTIPCDTIALLNAIEMANNTKEQVAIGLEPGCIYHITEPYEGEHNWPLTGLPTIASPIIIHGNGATIEISYELFTLGRLFYIAPHGSLTINNANVGGDPTSDFGGGGNSEGGLILNHGHLRANNIKFDNGYADEGGSIANTGTAEIYSCTFETTEPKQSPSFGGSIYNKQGSLSINESSFKGFKAHVYGGVIYSEHEYSGGIEISNSEFLDSSCHFSKGGAIYADGDLTISNSIFSNSEALRTPDDHYGLGGAIYVNGALSITGSQFTGNRSSWKGGAIYQKLGDLNIESSIFQSNASLQGGAIYHYGSHNHYAQGSYLNIVNSQFTDNSSDEHGGVLFIEYADHDSYIGLTNSTLSQNSGDSIVYQYIGPLKISYTTIVNNIGTGVLSDPFGPSEVTINNSIIANNQRDCFNIESDETTIANLDSDGTCSGFPITADPLLEPLANNGGPTLTHALLPNSPALNAATGECPATDQRGEVRPGGAACDLGAYEVEDEELAGAEFGDIPEINTPDDTPLDPPLDLNICVARVQELVLCKEGPGDEYQTVSSLKPDGIIEITGQSLAGDYAVIRNPCFPELRCWVRKSHLVFFCDDELLPLASTPPLTSPDSDRSGAGQGACKPGATNQTDCENSGGTWVVPMVEAPYCACP